MHATLPAFPSVLVFCAHPDDASFGLGAILSTLADAGRRRSVRCFTHGEASTLHGVTGTLGDIRSTELAAAGEVLGVSSVELLDYPGGALNTQPLDELAGCWGASPTTTRRRPSWPPPPRSGFQSSPGPSPTPPPAASTDEFATTFAGRGDNDLDITVDRTRQLDVICCHHSQSADNPVLWRRLDLLGATAHLRYLS
jgi:hypothetical protein